MKNAKSSKKEGKKEGKSKGYRDDPRYLRDLAESELACMQEILRTLKDIQEELRGRRTWDPQTPTRPQTPPQFPPWQSPWCPPHPGITRWTNDPDYIPSTTPCTPTDPYGNPVVYSKTFATSADGTARIN